MWDVVDESRDPSSPTSPQPQQQQQQLIPVDSGRHQDSEEPQHEDTLAQEHGETSQLMADP